MSERPQTDGLNKLFVYGIFLDEANRRAYGMSNPRYQTVSGYATFGKGIVMAYPVNEEAGLTGLVVDVDPDRWESIDNLEYRYDRFKVTTDLNEEVWMYGRHNK